jgi:hypothetical protein
MTNTHSLNGGRIAKTLSPLASGGADARQVADASVAIWSAIDRALSPVIGQRGSAALYQRSLHLARADFPWLAAAYESAAEPRALGALHAALVQQTAEHAAAAHDRVLHTLLGLLADLIGQSLTERLLKSAWDSPSSGNAVQDTLP